MFPSADVVLDTMIPNYLTGVIYGCLVEAYASENNARMTANAVFHRQRKKRCCRIFPFSLIVHGRRPSHRKSQRLSAAQKPREGSDKDE